MKKYIKPATEIITAEAETVLATWSMNGGETAAGSTNPDDELLWTSDQDALAKDTGWDLW
ncbi:MAG: hypothetical protein LUC49_04805 [Prevotella sp.]|nr:hypothetical protein [Prevotella sp.]MCD8305962.1 hypothetical protein [Prevotella sp.]